MKESKYYVYEYFNPLTKEVFYVGKGTGDRVSNHFDEALAGEISDKHERIRELVIVGFKFEDIQRIVKYGMTEDEAHELEEKMIEDYGLENLTNKVSGHSRKSKALKQASRTKTLSNADRFNGTLIMVTDKVRLSKDFDPELTGFYPLMQKSRFDTVAILNFITANPQYSYGAKAYDVRDENVKYIVSHVEKLNKDKDKEGASIMVWLVDDNEEIIDSAPVARSANNVAVN